MVPEGKGLWCCLSCGLVRPKKDLRRHIEAKHLENTEVGCDLCMKKFKTRDVLRKHSCVAQRGQIGMVGSL